MFQHFVITRFNLRDPALEKANGNKPLLDDTWMTDRLALFEEYCFSSLKAQSNKNFTWLVFFDVSTPDIFRETISRFHEEFPNFTPIYIEGMDAYYPEMKKEITQRLTSPFLITSRIDNDDCWHQDFINEVQKQFNQQDFMAIDFVDGYTLQIEPGVRLAYRSHVHNPFISLIEKADNFVTVWSRKRHGSWSKVRHVKSVRNKRVWMSVIHEANATNTFLGYGDIDWQLINDFNICPQRVAQLAQNIIPFEQWQNDSQELQRRTKWKVMGRLFRRRFLPFLLKG